MLIFVLFQCNVFQGRKLLVTLPISPAIIRLSRAALHLVQERWDTTTPRYKRSTVSGGGWICAELWAICNLPSTVATEMHRIVYIHEWVKIENNLETHWASSGYLKWHHYLPSPYPWSPLDSGSSKCLEHPVTNANNLPVQKSWRHQHFRSLPPEVEDWWGLRGLQVLVSGSVPGSKRPREPRPE